MSEKNELYIFPCAITNMAMLETLSLVSVNPVEYLV